MSWSQKGRISDSESSSAMLASILAEAGCLWLAAYDNNKVIRRGVQPIVRIPTGNAHVVLAPNRRRTKSGVCEHASGLAPPARRPHRPSARTVHRGGV